MSETTNEAAKHVEKKVPPGFFDFLFQPKFIVMLVIGLIALILLKTKKMKSGIKISLLLLSTFLFGIAGNIPADIFKKFAMHPSPMCAATKSLLYGFGMPFIVTLAVIFFLTLLGPKLFCGYVCPVGAVQELISMWSEKLKIKRSKTNFTVANTIRLSLFIVFIFVSATAILYITFKGKVYPKSLYDYINPFHGLEFEAEKTLIGYMTHYIPFILTVIFSFKYYRPFCHFVCPIGLYSHFLEQISIFRISFKKKACTDCNICVNEAPCTAMEDILKKSTLRPDCYACNKCIEVCPENALEIGIKKTEL
ncbi:MAG: 4Fe-4S binding protein [Acidobacteriota bacterium]